VAEEEPPRERLGRQIQGDAMPGALEATEAYPDMTFQTIEQAFAEIAPPPLS